MATSTTAIIIMVVALVLFATEKIPLVVTAIMAMLAMAFFGIISYQTAFSGFSHRVVLMILGMSIISSSFTSVGLSTKISHFLIRFQKLGEKKFIVLVFLLSACLGPFVVPMIVVTMLAPIMDFVSAGPDSKIRRKMTYLPLAIGSSVGSNLSCLSASCILAASAMLANSYYGRGMTIFEPFKVAIPGVVVCLLFYMTIGHKWQERCFDFQEIPAEPLQAPPSGKSEAGMTWRCWFVLVVAVGCITAFIMGGNMGAFALLGACLVMGSGCIKPSEAFRGVSWNTVLTVAASLGFAQGIAESGAGQLIADAIMSLCGPLGQSPFGMCVVILFLSTLLSNFMSNTATVTTIFPIAIVIAQMLDTNAMAFALACGIGADIAIATPICVAQITYTVGIGYRVKDYLRVGGLLNLMIFIVDAIALYFCYFL